MTECTRKAVRRARPDASSRVPVVSPRVVVADLDVARVCDLDAVRRLARMLVTVRRCGIAVVAVATEPVESSSEIEALASRVARVPAPRELDLLPAARSRIACALLAVAVDDLGYSSISLTSEQAGIVTGALDGDGASRPGDPGRVWTGLERGEIVFVTVHEGDRRSSAAVDGPARRPGPAATLAAALRASIAARERSLAHGIEPPLGLRCA